MDKKETKQFIQKEIVPYLIGIRNEIAEGKGTAVHNKFVLKGKAIEVKTRRGKDGKDAVVDYDKIFDYVKGNLPVRGKDFFTDSDIKTIIDTIYDKLPTREELKGKDGNDGVVDYSVVEKLAKPLIETKYKEIKNELDVLADKVIKILEESKPKELNARDIRNKLESLTGNDRLDAKAIKGLEKFMTTFISTSTGGGGGSSPTGGGVVNSIVAGTNIFVDATDPANPIVSATGTGGGAVDSVNGQTGVVSLDLQDITDVGATTTNTVTISPSGNNKALVANGSGSGIGIDITHSGSGTKLKIGTAGSGDLIDAGDFNVDSSGNVTAGGLELADTVSSTTGLITKNGDRFIHNYQNPAKDGKNTFIGKNSGNFSMTGSLSDSASYNVGIGDNTLTSNTSGSFNVAIGTGALNANTTGYANTAIGRDALKLNTTGVNNFAIGDSALANNTTGNGNFAIGIYAMEGNETGSGNLAIGGGLSQLTSGESNIVLGSGLVFQNGDDTIAIGSQIANGFTPSFGVYDDINQGVLIGNNSSPLDNPSTNEIVIGHGAVGNGSNTATVGNSSTTDTYLKGNIVGSGSVKGTSFIFEKGTFDMNLASASITGSSKTITFPNATGTLPLGTGTTNELAYWSGTNTVASLATATYPSLTELSYVKGVTSAIQTQLNAKAPLASPTFTGTVTVPSTLNFTSQGSIVKSGNHAVTLTSTATTNATFPAGTTTLASVAGSETLTNKRIVKRSLSVVNDTTLDIDTDLYDYAEDTGLTGNVTVTWSGTPTVGQTLWVSFTGTASRLITWDLDFESSTVSLPPSTSSTDRLDVGFVWNAATSKFRCVATC